MVRHSSDFRFSFLLLDVRERRDPVVFRRSRSSAIEESQARHCGDERRLLAHLHRLPSRFLQRRRHRPRNHFDVACGRQQCFLQGRDRLQRGFDGFGLGRGAKLSRKDLDLHRRQTAPVIRQPQRDQRATRSPGQESRRQLARRLGDHSCLSGAQALRPRTRKRRYRHAHGGLRRGPAGRAWSRGWSMRRSSPCRKTSSPRKKAITS